MCDIYKIFSRDWKDMLDYSEQAMLELYVHESFGEPVSDKNGYYVGKKWLNVNVAMWKEDLSRGLLFLSELYNDEIFPHWWLDSVFKITS